MITATVSGSGGFTNTYDDDTNPHIRFATIDSLIYHAARVMANATGYVYHVSVYDDHGRHSAGSVYSDHVRHCIGLSILPCGAVEAFEYHGAILKRQLEQAN